jgi:hypothetical protein
MPSTLSVAELRTLAATELTDAALQLLIDAAEEQLATLPVGQVTERYRGGSSVIILRWPAASVDSVTEVWESVVVPPAEYRLSPTDSRSLWRSIPGTGEAAIPATSELGVWRGPVTVVSTPLSLASLRKVATAQLVKGAISNNPGVLGMTEGNFTIQFENGSTWSAAVDDALAVADAPWNFS